MPPFHVRQRVMLISNALPVPAGSEGVVIGFYRRDPETCLVRFEEETYEVAPEELVAADEPPGDRS